MIVYDIICDSEHKFEGWFNAASDFESQKKSGLLTCPICGSSELERMSAPSVKTSKNSLPRDNSMSIREVASKLIDFIDKNFEDVGRNFADEARKIHYGDAEERSIKGTATKEEADALKDEGIGCITLAKPKLNS